MVEISLAQQSAAVRAALIARRGRITSLDARRLEEAANTLAALGEMKERVEKIQGADDCDESKLSDELAADIVRILGLELPPA